MPTPNVPRYVDDRPVRFVLVDTVEESLQFPAGVVLADRPSASRRVLGALLALPVAACVVGSFGADAVGDRVDAWGGGAALASVLVGLVLLAVNWRRGDWLLYPVALVVALPALVALGAGPVGIAVATIALAGGGVAAWRGDRARDRRWARLSALLTRRERADATVAGVATEPVPNAARLRCTVTVTADAVPGVVWAFVELSSATFRPQAGQPMSVWYDPADPAVAVVSAAAPSVAGRLAPPA
ncbi:hypothetical protein [Cellulomonas chitinilytica]|uniref:hypothetical protein n=1 Tax=Cellulomonas chitinilytica TaxID=398759 RepID=UPI0019450503|nr:hypothetical protein [Cellulomonas chitinilytica]